MAGHPDFSPELFGEESRRRLLATISAHVDVVRASAVALEHAVVAARYAGITWDDIGARLQTTRQGAWKRFHKQVTFDAHIKEAGPYPKRSKKVARGRDNTGGTA